MSSAPLPQFAPSPAHSWSARRQNHSNPLPPPQPTSSNNSFSTPLLHSLPFDVCSDGLVRRANPTRPIMRPISPHYASANTPSSAPSAKTPSPPAVQTGLL